MNSEVKKFALASNSKKSSHLKLSFSDPSDETQYKYIIYIDEAGRGCLAGPVFVGAVLWPQSMNKDDTEWTKIKDSKKLSKKKRNSLIPYIKKSAKWAIGTSSVDEIDEYNILQATFTAMHRAIYYILKELGPRATSENVLLCIDGNSFKPYMHKGCFLSHVCVPHGDDAYVGIAAASILAKVNHDDYITELCEQESSLDENYGWKKNMCYGTKQHREGIMKHGITKHHRVTFGCCNTKKNSQSQ